MVTFRRQSILCREENIRHLRAAFKYAKSDHPFTVEAVVILPDHIHCILTLPDNDADYPTRLRLIKTYFSRRCPDDVAESSSSRRNKKEKSIWQRRYWEHAIRDGDDFKRHVEYIHYNPVKHGLVDAPKEWKYSSFHMYARKGIYEMDWGAGDAIVPKGDTGGE